MGNYIVRRLVAAVPVLFGLTVIVFGIMALIPGDPAQAILGAYATPENVERINRDLGLDKTLVEQYVIWLTNLLQGDFGRSYSLNRPVIDEVLERFSATLILAGSALVLCSVFGLLAGIVSAVRQFGWADRAITFLVLIGISTPSFWLGLLLILLFAVNLKLLPASGMFAIYGGGDLPDLLQHLVLPAVTLSVVATGVIARLTRTAMLEVLRQDYIRTARAKGLSAPTVILKHALRNALVPVVALAAVQLGFLLGGSVVIETIFALDGLGFLAYQSITHKDLPVTQAIVALLSFVYIGLTLAADLANAWLDPRIRVG